MHHDRNMLAFGHKIFKISFFCELALLAAIQVGSLEESEKRFQNSSFRRVGGSRLEDKAFEYPSKISTFIIIVDVYYSL